MVARLLRSADFERVLAAPPRSRSTHFAAHHLPAWPSLAAKPRPQTAPEATAAELSTADARACPPAVEESPRPGAPTAPAGWWLGLVVPKRHARRAVTRTLLKRQMRVAMAEQAAALQLPAGLWVLRLKSPFDRQQFVSAASDALRASARAELLTLLQRAAARAPLRA
ncbi:MAG: ribonuclease P protein component [Burkholderiaceae bacterium]|nr:ribonuclease P protein component [Burkholderiaceae bacterium]